MAMVMALITTRGCRQALGHGRRLLVMALVFVFCIALLLDGVHCDTTAYAPAPTPTRKIIPTYRDNEVDALNAIRTKWMPLNPQLATLLNWTSDVKPCEGFSHILSDYDNEFIYEGAWRGISCRAIREGSNATGDYLDITVTLLRLYGSHSSCDGYHSSQCGFEGITGELPSEIGNLTNLQSLVIPNNPNLTGPVPKEIFQLPFLDYLWLNNNSLSGTLTSEFDSFKYPQYLMNISHNKFNGTFFGSNLNPISVDLSHNHFKTITLDIYNTSSENMPILKNIFMQNNNFTGTFPSEILKSPNLILLNCDQNQYEELHLPVLLSNRNKLSNIYFTNNNLKSVEYASHGPLSSDNLNFSSPLFLGGNPFCDQIKNPLLATICRFNESSSKLDVEIVKRTFPKKKIIIITTTTSLSFVFILLVGATFIWRLMHRIKSLRIILKEFEKNEVKPNLYSLKEIKLATNNFDKNNKLGEGGFGIVYKGVLKDNSYVAVKKLTISSNQVLSEFLHEVVVISGLKHRNLVKLKGCCLGDGDQRMLIFEYVENKNLAQALWQHDNSERLIEFPLLNWNIRFNIILDIARGLTYLHEDLQSPIIHRDIKGANILLDKDYNPKIADFGLAFLYPTLESKASHLTLMQIAGTRGYCSPEYALHGHVSTSIDVYSFGIVALEIVSGRKNIDPQKSEEEIYLREWAWKQHEAQATMSLIDPKMKHSPMDVEAIMRVISVALMCVHYTPTKRPKMHDVVSMLCGKAIIDDFSRGFEHGDSLEDITTNLSSGSTSLHHNKLTCIDERSLLSDVGDSEINVMA